MAWYLLYFISIIAVFIMILLLFVGYDNNNVKVIYLDQNPTHKKFDFDLDKWVEIESK